MRYLASVIGAPTFGILLSSNKRGPLGLTEGPEMDTLTEAVKLYFPSTGAVNLPERGEKAPVLYLSIVQPVRGVLPAFKTDPPEGTPTEKEISRGVNSIGKLVAEIILPSLISKEAIFPSEGKIPFADPPFGNDFICHPIKRLFTLEKVKLNISKVLEMSIILKMTTSLDSIQDIVELTYLRQCLNIHTRTLAESIDNLDYNRGKGDSMRKFDEAIDLCLNIVLDFPIKIPHASPKTRELVEYVSKDCAEKLESYRNLKKSALSTRFGMWHVFGAIVVLGVIVGVVSEK